MATAACQARRNCAQRHRGVTGDQNGQIRADLVFFPTANGGAVFATGSIAWVCALSVNDYDNNVSQVMRNVLTRFLNKQNFDEAI